MKNSKQFYYIGEVSEKAGAPEHIIRYWEKEFSFLKPMRDQRGYRIYTEKDIGNIIKIKELLHSKGYKIRGAKKKMRSTKNSDLRNIQETKKILRELLKEIREIKKCLK